MNNNKIYISPSILSADLLQLEKQVKTAEENGADFIHVDIMDGHFVPNITFGANIVKVLKRFTVKPLDVHLMISNADQYLEDFANAGSDIITVHVEACTHLHRTLQNIHSLGKKAGVCLNPATSLYTLENVIDDIELLLIMSVNPGFGGQKFIENSIDKIATARKMIEATGKDIFLEVDGGINPITAKKVVDAGANMLVAGNAIFGQDDIAAAISAIRNSIS